MSKIKIPGVLTVLLLTSFLVNSQTGGCGGGTGNSKDLSQYGGRFELPDGSLLIIKENGGELTARPIFWTSIQALERKDGDKFGIEGRDDREIEVVRNGPGRISPVTVDA